MPFPKVHAPPPIQPEHPRIDDREAVERLTVRINDLCNGFGIADRPSVRAASVVYLGLCRLKHYTESAAQEAGRKHCQEIVARYKPEESPRFGLNASCFKKLQEKDAWIDHGLAIAHASGIYLPRIRARKKRHFVMLVLGTEHSAVIPLPNDDTWLTGFRF